jgi:hypothetical protein
VFCRTLRKNSRLYVKLQQKWGKNRNARDWRTVLLIFFWFIFCYCYTSMYDLTMPSHVAFLAFIMKHTDRKGTQPRHTVSLIRKVQNKSKKERIVDMWRRHYRAYCAAIWSGEICSSWKHVISIRGAWFIPCSCTAPKKNTRDTGQHQNRLDLFPKYRNQQ